MTGGVRPDVRFKLDTGVQQTTFLQNVDLNCSSRKYYIVYVAQPVDKYLTTAHYFVIPLCLLCRAVIVGSAGLEVGVGVLGQSVCTLKNNQ